MSLADFFLTCCFSCFGGALGSTMTSSPSVSDSNDCSENRLDILLQSSFKDFKKEWRPDALVLPWSLSSEDGDIEMPWSDCVVASDASDAVAANDTMSLSYELAVAKEMDSLR